MQIPPVTDTAAVFTIASSICAAGAAVSQVIIKHTYHGNLSECKRKMEEILGMIEKWAEYFESNDRTSIAEAFIEYIFLRTKTKMLANKLPRLQSDETILEQNAYFPMYLKISSIQAAYVFNEKVWELSNRVTVSFRTSSPLRLGFLTCPLKYF